MRNFLAFQEFKPSETGYSSMCIWCGKNQPKNRSHIISKKLTKKNHPVNVLRNSVCESCNNKFSRLENWILRNTPFAWVRLFCYHASNILSGTNYILSYFYANEHQDWIVYTLEGSKETRQITCQLIVKNGNLIFISEHAPNIAAFHYNRLFESVRNNDFAEYVEGSLPPDFSPRAIIKGDNVIVIAKDANGLLEAKRCIGGAEYEPSTASHLRFTDDGRNFQHFKWSKSNWVKFCAKVAFEFLCLFEGAEFCLRSEFDQVRSYATSSISKEGRKLTFNEHGPVTNNDMPMPVYVDLSKGQDCPQNINALLSHSELGTHTIDIYEINGWIYASISIAGFPPSLLVLGGPDIHLRDFYSAVYDDEEDEFHYLKLAYDKTMPVIPMHVRGGQMGEVAKTYNLKAI